MSQSYNLYQEASIQTAGRGNLVVMLYDEAIKQIAAAMRMFNAERKIEVQNIEAFNSHLLKAQAIVSELEATLNMDTGEIARNLLNLYIFFNQELVEGNIKRDLEKLASVKVMMSDLRDSWRQIANSAPQNQVVGVEIEG